MGRRMASTKRKQVVPTQQARTLTICANVSRCFTCGGNSSGKFPKHCWQQKTLISSNRQKTTKWWDFEHCHLSLPTAGNQLKVNLKVLQAGPAAVFKLSVSCMVAGKVKNSISRLKIKRLGKKEQDLDKKNQQIFPSKKSPNDFVWKLPPLRRKTSKTMCSTDFDGESILHQLVSHEALHGYPSWLLPPGSCTILTRLQQKLPR